MNAAIERQKLEEQKKKAKEAENDSDVKSGEESEVPKTELQQNCKIFKLKFIFRNYPHMA